MQELKSVFERAGMTSVTTYINSGNVIFSTRARSRARLEARLEAAIADHFGFHVKVLLRDLERMRGAVRGLAPEWVNDETMKCDVLFLWEDVDGPEVLKELTIRADIDDVRYVPGAVLWRVDREHLTRSGMMQVARTPLYQQMTIRNCNTVRKLLELMEEVRTG